MLKRKDFIVDDEDVLALVRPKRLFDAACKLLTSVSGDWVDGPGERAANGLDHGYENQNNCNYSRCYQSGS